jgi:hypothetical protein
MFSGVMENPTRTLPLTHASGRRWHSSPCLRYRSIPRSVTSPSRKRTVPLSQSIGAGVVDRAKRDCCGVPATNCTSTSTRSCPSSICRSLLPEASINKECGGRYARSLTEPQRPISTLPEWPAAAPGRSARPMATIPFRSSSPVTASSPRHISAAIPVVTASTQSDGCWRLKHTCRHCCGPLHLRPPDRPNAYGENHDQGDPHPHARWSRGDEVG